MAKERPISPEKQLLSLIESSKTNKVDVQARAVKHQRLSLFSFGAWVGRISFFKGVFKKRPRGVKRHHLDIKLVNKLLGLCIFALAVYFTNDLFGSLDNFKNTPNLEFKPQESASLADSQAIPFLKKEASYYFEKVRERDIFKMGKKMPAAEEAAPPQEDQSPKIQDPTSKIVEKTKNLKLVGISWSNNPDVMIEDTKALSTFFVRRGQMIGEVKVQAIFKDKVVLSYEGEETELR